MATIQEIRREYEAQKADIVSRCFDLQAVSMTQEAPISEDVAAKLPKGMTTHARAVQQQMWAEKRRDELFAEWVRLDVEEMAALDVRVEQVEELLSPKSVTSDEILRASTMDEQGLITAMDLGLQLGDAGEDTVLLCFQVARQKDYEAAVGHAIEAREDLGGLYVELLEVNKYPRLDEQELKARWEVIAPPAPTQQEILTKTTTPINAFGGLR